MMQGIDEIQTGRAVKVPCFILHLANRPLSPLGEAFARCVIEADAQVQAEEAAILRAWSAKPSK